MDINSDYVIKNNVVIKYQGSGSEVVVPSGVERIGQNAFSNCQNIKSVTLPSSVHGIETRAFWNCKNLSHIDLPVSLEFIGEKAFYQCPGLTAIALPQGMQSIGSYAFSNCTGLTNVSIPDDFPYISEGMFFGCEGLESIVIPSSIEHIDDEAFSGCDSLSNIVIANGVKEIGALAFRECTSLQEISIPESVRVIGCRAFEYCDELSEITLPSSMESIESGAFWECYSLSNIKIPSGLTTISSALFIRSGLERITIPNGVTIIEDSAFYECENLKEVQLPDSIISIAGRNLRHEEFGSFAGCIALERFEIPKNLKLDLDSVRGCLGLKEFVASKDSPYYTVMDGVLFSKDKRKLIAFPPGKECEKYYIPETVDEIGANAFLNTNCVQQVFIANNVKKVAKAAFEKGKQAPVVFYSNADFSDCLPRQVYIGGPLSDLPTESQENAVDGFLFTMRMNINSLDPWKDSYISYIAKNATVYKKKAKKDKTLAMIMDSNSLR